MDPAIVIALIAASGAISGAVVSWRNSIDANKIQRQANDTTSQLESVKVQLDAWDKLNEAHVEELSRKDAEITRKDQLIVELYGRLQDQPKGKK